MPPNLAARCRAIETSADALALDKFSITILIGTRDGWEASCAGVRAKMHTDPHAALDELAAELAERNRGDILARTLGLVAA